MKREILYKAKRKDNGEWVYGDLLHPDYEIGRDYAIEDIDKSKKNNCHEVIYETVCEYTGLTDKNGTKIFENDLLKILSSVKDKHYNDCGYCNGYDVIRREDIAIVEYDRNTGGYRLKVYHKGKYKRISRFTISHLINYEAEVIGNYHDNPELLKGDEL